MKKMMVITACTLYAIAYGAENTKDLMLSVGGTLFHIVKDDIYKYHAAVDFMVLGNNQQRKLSEPDFGDTRKVGSGYMIEDRKIRVLPKESDSASDDDTYKSYSTKAKLWKKAKDEVLECTVTSIIEPRIMQGRWEFDQVDTYGYFPVRPHPEKKDHFLDLEFFGDEAIIEASKDLQMCYHKVLQHGLKVLGDKDDKKIALASLGTDVGFPRKTAAPITFAAIVKFLTNNPGKYSLVQLFIKKRSEFSLYRELIRQYLVSQQ